MSDVVFILGAGASKAAGAPLMADFLDTAYGLWKRQKVTDYDEQFSAVFRSISALQSVHSKSQLDLNNVESVFSALEMAATLGRLPGSEDSDTGQVVDALKLLIAVTIEQTLEIPWVSGGPHAPEPYGEFVDLIDRLTREADPHRTVSVLTFNYDLACDYAFHQRRAPLDYALQEGAAQGSIPLLKLHGSLNWAYCEGVQAVVPWTMGEYFRTRHWEPFRVQGDHVRLGLTPELGKFQYQGHGVRNEPVLVPPTWNKTDYRSDIACVWSRAASELSDAEDIFVIGYSLPETDAFFRHLYALGTVGEVPLKRFWVFNPDPQVEERFRTLLGPGALARFRYFSGAFGTFRSSLRTIAEEYVQ